MEPRETVLLCVRYALDKKAYDLVVLEVTEWTSLADYFVICTGRSDTQVRAIVQGIEEHLQTLGLRPLAVEGLTTGHWVVIDYGAVVVHVFFEPIREVFDLERVWARAPRMSLPEPYRSQARQLRLRDEPHAHARSADG